MAFLILGVEPLLALSIVALIGSGLVWYGRARNGKPANQMYQRIGFVMLIASFGVSVPLMYSAIKGSSSTPNVSLAENNASNDATPVLPSPLNPSPPVVPASAIVGGATPSSVPASLVSVSPAPTPTAVQSPQVFSPSPSPPVQQVMYAQPSTPIMIPTTIGAGSATPVMPVAAVPTMIPTTMTSPTMLMPAAA